MACAKSSFPVPLSPNNRIDEVPWAARMARSRAYTKAGLPWFDYSDADAAAVEGAEKLKDLISVANLGAQKGAVPLPGNEGVDVERIIALRKKGAREQVREMPA